MSQSDDPHVRAFENKRFPLSVIGFPREQWDNVPFVWPIFDDTSELDKCQWAGKEASLRWRNAFDNRDMGELDVVDFAVAVFDKADEL